uniref:Succinate dehydrogenase [ubiquinone] cytochrome b small subunit n=2 Tax=Parascaris univalens TaxID=6257 RepID=A0A915BCI4_PARUN
MLSAVRRAVPLSARILRTSLIQRCAGATSAAVTGAAPAQFDPVAAEKGFKPLHNHGTLFKIERYFAAAMVPLMPAAYFIHGREMDLCLALALSLHIHWGVWGVVNDYGRPFVLGDTLAAAVRVGAYIFTACLLAGLLYFNEHDVGLTRAFEMVWEL